MKPLPHQLCIAEQIKHVHGIVLCHGLGTGKTYTAINAFETLKLDKPNLIAHVVVPSKLKENFLKELNNAKVNLKNYFIFSHESYSNNISDKLNNVFLIIDEAHKIRTASTKTSKAISSAAKKAFKVLCLTATPFVNYPNDLAVLINMCNLNSKLPTSREAFETLFLKNDNYQNIIINKKKLLDSCKNHLSCIYTDTHYFPSEKRIKKTSIMTPKQQEIYNIYENQTLTKQEKKILNEYDIKNVKVLNSFLNKTRSVSNTPYIVDPMSHIRHNKNELSKSCQDSNKFYDIINTIKEENTFPVIIYSNFLNTGLYPLEYLCIQENWDTKLICGDTKDTEIKNIIHLYNSGQIKILLISSAAGYGLDLKGTRQIHITEPNWNQAKIDQVIGRGIRYKSHVHLPSEEQNVTIFNWLSVFKTQFFKTPKISADEYMFYFAEQKNSLLLLFKELCCEASIENTVKYCRDLGLGNIIDSNKYDDYDESHQSNLPSGWDIYYNETTNQYYYYNKYTNETQYKKPRNKQKKKKL